MRQKFVFLNFIGLVFLGSLTSKASFACGGMTFPGSLLCGSSGGVAYSSGYPSLTASLVYVPTSLLGGYSQPISYPPNPFAPKTTTSTSTPSYTYPSYYSYPSAYSYPSYGCGGGYPSYGLSGLGSCGTSTLFPSYGSAGGLLPTSLYGGMGGLGTCGGGLYGGLTGLGSLGGPGGLGGCGSGTSLFPSYGFGYPSSGYSTPSYGYSYPSSGYSTPITNSPVVTVLAPATHGCSTNGASGGIPVYSAPRPVCVQFCGVARNLMRPISRGLSSNRLY
ncbi:MAG: hypothetical protein EBQ92_07625 [Proteobacteria bacterium]|nr:hypothetical protein [Pseudomonadota bacterium]